MNLYSLARPSLGLLMSAFLLATVGYPSALPADEPRMYRVEIVLVRHTDRNALLTEVWQSGRVANLERALDPSDLGEDLANTGFRDMSGTPFGLRGVVTRLEQSPLYEVIASYAWEQPGLPREEAVPLRVRTGRLLGYVPRADEPPAFAPWQPSPVMQSPHVAQPMEESLYEVDGTVTLSLARFLHLHTDLLYRRAMEEPVPGDYVSTVDGRVFVESHIDERRRMRSDEIHYIDHPLAGVIVQITPVERR